MSLKNKWFVSYLFIAFEISRSDGSKALADFNITCNIMAARLSLNHMPRRLVNLIHFRQLSPIDPKVVLFVKRPPVEK